MASHESILNGRFRYLQRPAVSPGCCKVCGAVDRPVVDFGLQDEFDGATYICVTCVSEAYEVVKYFAGDGADTAAHGTPLPAIDIEALNEFLRTADDTLSRIIAIVPDSYLLPDDLEDAEDSAESNGESVSDAPADGNSQSESDGVEGPDDSSSTIGSIFDGPKPLN